MEKENSLGKNGILYLYDEFEGDFSKNLREYLTQLGRKEAYEAYPAIFFIGAVFKITCLI